LWLIESKPRTRNAPGVAVKEPQRRISMAKDIKPLPNLEPQDDAAEDAATPAPLDDANAHTPSENIEPQDDAAEGAIAPLSSDDVSALDAEEAEFRALRRDLPGVKGASAAGIVTISVGKIPTKNEFFRTHKEFQPIVPIVDLEVNMEQQFFAVTSDMVVNLNGIGITVTDHVLYLTITSRGAIRVLPVRQANAGSEQNEWDRTREIALVKAVDEWVRLYSDRENSCYRVFPAKKGRFPEPQFPLLKPAKIFKLAFRDKGRLVDSTEHSLFKKLAARDSG
jgi:hypothetical protein